jgi:hypothetical protein
MIINAILIYAVGLALQLSSCVTILNRCLNIELVSPVYFGNGTVCPRLSSQQIDIGAKVNASFEINAAYDEFEGALLFKLKRSSGWSNIATLIEVDKKETTNVHILIAWKLKDSRIFLRVVLVEHTKEFTWNEDKLKKLYDKNCGWLKEHDNTISDAWLVDDNMILKTSFRARVLKGNFDLSISVSEEEDSHAIRPLFVDLKR